MVVVIHSDMEIMSGLPRPRTTPAGMAGCKHHLTTTQPVRGGFGGRARITSRLLRSEKRRGILCVNTATKMGNAEV